MSGFIRRRRGLLLSAALVLGLLSAAAALLVPPTYRASALLEAELPEAERRSARSPEAWLEGAGSQVLSDRALLGVARGLGLGESARPARVAEALRRGSELRLTGEEGSAVSFSLTVAGRDATAVERAVEGLSALFLAENRPEPEPRAAPDPRPALREELGRAEAAVAALDAELAALRRAREAERAEQAAWADRAAAELRRTEQLSRELEELGRRAGQLGERRAALEVRLAGTPATLVVEAPREEPRPAGEGPAASSPEDEGRSSRLQELQSQLAALERILGPRHPDVVKLRGAAERLAGEDLRRAERLAAEERERAARAAPPPAREEVSNPAHSALEAELASLRGEIEGVEREQRSRRAESARSGQQAAAAPRAAGAEPPAGGAKAEAEWDRISREHGEAGVRLATVRARLAGIEEADPGGGAAAAAPASVRYRRVEGVPPAVERTEPNRLGIFLAGLLVSVGLAFAGGLTRDVLDRSVKTPEELGALAGLPVLAVLPLGERPPERRRRKVRWAAWALAGGLGLAALAVALDRNVAPLGTLWPELQTLVARRLLF